MLEEGTIRPTPGERTTTRLSARQARKVKLGLSTTLLLRSAAFDDVPGEAVTEGDLVYLSGAPFYAMMRRLAMARARRAQRMAASERRFKPRMRNWARKWPGESKARTLNLSSLDKMVFAPPMASEAPAEAAPAPEARRLTVRRRGDAQMLLSLLKTSRDGQAILDEFVEELKAPRVSRLAAAAPAASRTRAKNLSTVAARAPEVLRQAQDSETTAPEVAQPRVSTGAPTTARAPLRATKAARPVIEEADWDVQPEEKPVARRRPLEQAGGRISRALAATSPLARTLEQVLAPTATRQSAQLAEQIQAFSEESPRRNASRLIRALASAPPVVMGELLEQGDAPARMQPSQRAAARLSPTSTRRNGTLKPLILKSPTMAVVEPPPSIEEAPVAAETRASVMPRPIPRASRRTAERVTQVSGGLQARPVVSRARPTPQSTLTVQAPEAVVSRTNAVEAAQTATARPVAVQTQATRAQEARVLGQSVQELSTQEPSVQEPRVQEPRIRTTTSAPVATRQIQTYQDDIEETVSVAPLRMPATARAALRAQAPAAATVATSPKVQLKAGRFERMETVANEATVAPAMFAASRMEEGSSSRSVMPRRARLSTPTSVLPQAPEVRDVAAEETVAQPASRPRSAAATPARRRNAGSVYASARNQTPPTRSASATTLLSPVREAPVRAAAARNAAAPKAPSRSVVAREIPAQGTPTPETPVREAVHRESQAAASPSRAEASRPAQSSVATPRSEAPRSAAVAIRTLENEIEALEVLAEQTAERPSLLSRSLTRALVANGRSAVSSLRNASSEAEVQDLVGALMARGVRADAVRALSGVERSAQPVRGQRRASPTQAPGVLPQAPESRDVTPETAASTPRAAARSEARRSETRSDVRSETRSDVRSDVAATTTARSESIRSEAAQKAPSAQRTAPQGRTVRGLRVRPSLRSDGRMVPANLDPELIEDLLSLVQERLSPTYLPVSTTGQMVAEPRMGALRSAVERRLSPMLSKGLGARTLDALEGALRPITQKNRAMTASPGPLFFASAAPAAEGEAQQDTVSGATPVASSKGVWVSARSLARMEGVRVLRVAGGRLVAVPDTQSGTAQVGSEQAAQTGATRTARAAAPRRPRALRGADGVFLAAPGEAGLSSGGIATAEALHPAAVGGYRAGANNEMSDTAGRPVSWALRRTAVEAAPQASRERRTRSAALIPMGLPQLAQAEAEVSAETASTGSTSRMAARAQRTSQGRGQGPAQGRGSDPRPRLARTQDLGSTLHGVSVGAPAAEAPNWANRSSEERTGIRTVDGLVQALARASSVEDVVRVIVERSEGRMEMPKVLANPFNEVVQQIRSEARAEVKAEQTLPEPPVTRPSRVAAPATEQIRPVRSSASSFRHGGRTIAASARSVEGGENSRIMKLVRKLQGLIHLAEEERKLSDARRQVRMAEDSAAARAEGQAPMGRGANPAEQRRVDIEALGREVTEIVANEIASRRSRRMEDSDEHWW